jgi:hypothetical protein
MFGVSYTLSQSNDDGSNQRDVIPNTYDAHNLWGPSEFDSRNVLVFNYLYDLPFFKGQHGIAGKTLGGWQISGVTQFQTGIPCSVGVNNDYAGVGQDGSFGCGVGNQQLWNVVGSPGIIGGFAANGAKDPNFWFQTKNPDGSPIFRAPKQGTFAQGNVRDLIYMPGYQNWNLALFKTIPINERIGFQFRAEAFNFINHPNLGGASGPTGTGNGLDLNPNDAAFGKVTNKGGNPGSGGERNLQLSLRLYF